MDEFGVPFQDPSRHYRWLASDPKKLRRWLLQGRYELECGPTVETTKELAVKLFGPAGEHMVSDSLNRITSHSGDHYLASIPMEEYLRRREIIASMSRDRLSNAEDAYFDAASRTPHVRPFKREVEEIEDRKKFVSRESTNRVGYSGAATS
jgi:hypothetical protein